MWRPLFPAGTDVPIGHVTNGVHLPTWMAAPMRELLHRHLGQGWERRAVDPATWEPVENIPDADLWETRRRMRADLVAFLETLRALSDDAAEPLLVFGLDPDTEPAALVDLIEAHDPAVAATIACFDLDIETAGEWYLVPPAERERIQAALQALPDAQREIIVLRMLEELTFPEIGARLGVRASLQEEPLQPLVRGAGGAVAYLEGPEARQGDLLAGLQRVRDRVQDRVERLGHLALAELRAVRRGVDELLLVHGVLRSSRLVVRGRVPTRAGRCAPGEAVTTRCATRLIFAVRRSRPPPTGNRAPQRP